MAHIPNRLMVSEPSSLICNRPDWPLLVSMYTSSWRDVAEAMPLALPMLTKAVYSGEAMAMVAAFRQLHGRAPHPLELMDMLVVGQVEANVTGSGRRLSGAREEADINDH